MSVKLQPASEHKLCTHCCYSQVMTYDNGAERVYCTMFHPMQLIRRPVVQCSEFLDTNATTKHDMEKIAWTITTDKSGKAIGFKPPVKERERD